MEDNILDKTNIDELIEKLNNLEEENKILKDSLLDKKINKTPLELSEEKIKDYIDVADSKLTNLIEENPIPTMVGAFALGVILGKLTNRR